MTTFTLPDMPSELEWQNQPVDWKTDPADTLTITAGESSDWFIDPAGTGGKDNAPGALFVPPDTNFLLSARVTVDFASTFDAGVLQMRSRDDLWAKLCFEYSPQGQPTIVSVVTRGVSDDCNSAAIAGHTVYLRVSRHGQTFAFHYAVDGRSWHLVRYFSLGKLELLRVGFSSQSPTGKGCRAVFSEMRYRQGVLQDLRSGE